jgi:hypothetical protein
MEIIALLLLTGAGCGVYKAVQAARRERTTRQQRLAQENAEARQQQRLARERSRRARQRRNINAVARNLQLAILQLERAPDFQRAASWARQAGKVPLGFRQRQFRRLRTRLVQHFGARLRAGTNRELLLDSLRDLVQHLGVAPYEADYIAQEAEGNRERPAPPSQPGFADALEQLQRDHDERIEAIRGLATTDESIREQLLEAEMSRFRDAVMRRTESGASSTNQL